jgi:hypothetical protein
VARGYYDNTNILWQKDYFNKTDIGGTKWLSQRTKFLWREATATIQTFCDEKTISTTDTRGTKELPQWTKYLW